MAAAGNETQNAKNHDKLEEKGAVAIEGLKWCSLIIIEQIKAGSR
jgi:hypothetical protein